MANFTTDGQLCIGREINVEPHQFNDLSSSFDIEETCKWISDHNFTKISLQFPDELLPVSTKVYEEIKKRIDIDLYILGDTSYASCCIDAVAAMHVKSDAVVHYGHTCFTKTNIPVYIVLPKSLLNVDKVMKGITEDKQAEENNKLCLFYGSEYDHCKDNLKRIWFQCFPRSYIAYIEKVDHKDRFLGRLVQDATGQTYSVDILEDCFCIFIGSRGQTIFNLTISVLAKGWYLFNPDKNKLEHIDETSWMKRRRFLVEKCKDAEVVGILVCKLAGEQTKEIISRMKQLCRINGKKNYIVSVGKPNVAKLANFPEIDIYVMIACPENDLYSNRDFYKPIVYPYELEVALNSKRDQYFTTHVTDYDDLLNGKRHHCEIDNIKEETDVSLITGRIRETKVGHSQESKMELEMKQNWALENIGNNLHERSWKGLEQKLGETEVKPAQTGRKGIPLQYNNEPK
ncbi:unnamed protein product [Diatraea saccharalis]|uniref:2-(3-amino-3-carboxypropyl)histidine synthase subunit 2 n=1 Tax=Diatraea saccharalis TaxID=40085 RepID=A0A9N9RHP4_9NEOP|nr:unnamed protein product [Diatraea saccharalis]